MFGRRERYKILFFYTIAILKGTDTVIGAILHSIFAFDTTNVMGQNVCRYESAKKMNEKTLWTRRVKKTLYKHPKFDMAAWRKAKQQFQLIFKFHVFPSLFSLHRIITVEDIPNKLLASH